MERHNPAPLQSDSLAPKLYYLQRIMDHAFGAQGDRVILECHVGKSAVEWFNKETEVIECYSKQPEQKQIQKFDNRQFRRMR